MKILIADDEATNRLLLQVSVSKWGHEPVMAADGDEAWEVLQRNDAPALAILDWMMPGMDGTDVCRKLRSTPEPRMVYVIILTTNAEPGDIIAGLEAGADDYVTKPFDPSELHARVKVGMRMLELQAQVAEREVKLAEANARLAAKARFDAAVAAMSDGIVTTDGEGRITHANRAALLLLNLLETDFTVEALDQVLSRFSVSVDPDALLRSSDETTELEIARTDAGVPLYIDGRLTRLRDARERLTDVVLSLRDVTDERNARNVEANFMNLISHKMRTPLSILGGCLHLMQRSPADQAAAVLAEVMPIASQELQRLQTAVERLLQFKELSPEELSAESRPVALAAVLDAVEEELLENEPRKDIEFVSRIGPDAQLAHISARHLQTIVAELAENAVKFCPDRPVRIVVSTRRRDDGMVCISVADNGPGIPHEYLDRVFEGFVQIEEHVTGQVPGLGLGLRMVKQIADAYGGEVKMHSQIGKGTTVSVALPDTFVSQRGDWGSYLP